MYKPAKASDAFYPELADLCARLKRDARWKIFPRGWYILRDGSYVVFDYNYRPICLVHRERGVVIVLAKTWVLHVGQGFLYPATVHPASDLGARDQVLGVVERLGLSDELKRRRQQELDGTLPSRSVDTRTPA